MHRRVQRLSSALLGVCGIVAGAFAAGPPVARTEPVVDHQFGLDVVDLYRWMEGAANKEYDAWLSAQGEAAASALAAIPGRDALHARIRELGLAASSASSVQVAGGRTFYKRLAAGEQLPKLVVRTRDGKERVLVDPTTRGAAGSHASVNAYSPSPDGRLLAYDLALGGGEVSTLHVLDVATGRDLPDAIERIWGEFGANWLPDGKSFFYTQMAPASPDRDPMLGMRARLHRLGEPVARDVDVLGTGLTDAMPLTPEEFPGVGVQPGTQWLIATAGGAHNEARVAVAPLGSLGRDGKAAWRMVAEYDDSVSGLFIHGDRLYLFTFKNAPNFRIVSVPLAAPVLADARVEVAEDPAATLESMAPARDGLYLTRSVDGRTQAQRRDWNGVTTTLALPYEGWVYDLATDPLADGVTLDIDSWTRPDTYFAYDAAKNAFSPAGFGTSSTADYSGIVADEVEATSADGTKVPLSILHRKDLALDGSHPALVYGYAGYGVSENPSFSPTRLAWLERGGVFAICHARGGGEKGHRWQEDGTHEHKMNGVRDFIACGESLIERRFTQKSKLAGQAGSMGGILIGRAITERPDLFAAANVAVGIVNPLRTLAAENGANQKAELGDPETPEGYRSILAMDPYQHVIPGTAYPAVLFTVGLHDGRVAPWMTGKMAARMMTSTTSGRPILIRVEPDAGHGIGSTRDQAYAERADVWSFFLAAMGEKGFAAEAK